MTRRERLERKLEKRQEWAARRRESAAATFKRNEPFTSDYAFNTQPGHIPLRARIIKAEDRAFESLQVATHHESKAAGLESALDKSIFSDDSDAIEALEARIAEHEAERERMKTVNKLYKKQDVAGLAALGLDLEKMKQKLAAKGPYWGDCPHLAYELQNLGGRITADRKRLGVIKVRKQRVEAAEQAPNGVALEQCEGGYVRVTFAEKPDREVLDALKGAGFWWGNGSWAGKGDQLPEIVKSLLAPVTPLACQWCDIETVDVRKRFDELQLCELCDSEPTYTNQLRKARQLLMEKSVEAVNNPHAMIGRTCGCGTCFCCAAAQVVREWNERDKHDVAAL